MKPSQSLPIQSLRDNLKINLSLHMYLETSEYSFKNIIFIEVVMTFS